MVMVKEFYTPKYAHIKYLTEGELYCEKCLYHAGNCHCLQVRDREVTDEELAQLKAEGKVM
jgi:hypothetical protein